LEFREHPTLAEGEHEIGTAAPVEGHAVARAAEVDRAPVAVLSATRHGLVRSALAAHDLDRAIDIGIANAAGRALHVRAGEVADLNVRVDLERRRERQVLAFASLGLYARRPRYAQLAGADCSIER